MVYQAAHAVKIPVIGMGGIATAEDALEFILAGATAVSVGTMNFRNPAGTLEIIRGIEAYMERFEIQDIRELIGGVREYWVIDLYQNKFQEKLKEALIAVLPTIGIVLLLSFTIAPIPPSILLLFLFGERRCWWLA